ncbi:MAG: hypothetical protein JWN56_2367 [Sphingobacteriales bacterium]|nr:hypothetical protein [Sphingobacteriales bacterium]
MLCLEQYSSKFRSSPHRCEDRIAKGNIDFTLGCAVIFIAELCDYFLLIVQKTYLPVDLLLIISAFRTTTLFTVRSEPDSIALNKSLAALVPISNAG